MCPMCERCRQSSDVHIPEPDQRQADRESNPGARAIRAGRVASTDEHIVQHAAVHESSESLGRHKAYTQSVTCQ